jgi:hypothetical protein
LAAPWAGSIQAIRLFASGYDLGHHVYYIFPINIQNSKLKMFNNYKQQIKQKLFANLDPAATRTEEYGANFLKFGQYSP